MVEKSFQKYFKITAVEGNYIFITIEKRLLSMLFSRIFCFYSPDVYNKLVVFPISWKKVVTISRNPEYIYLQDYEKMRILILSVAYRESLSDTLNDYYINPGINTFTNI